MSDDDDDDDDDDDGDTDNGTKANIHQMVSMCQAWC